MLTGVGGRDASAAHADPAVPHAEDSARETRLCFRCEGEGGRKRGRGRERGREREREKKRETSGRKSEREREGARWGGGGGLLTQILPYLMQKIQLEKLDSASGAKSLDRFRGLECLRSIYLKSLGAFT